MPIISTITERYRANGTPEQRLTNLLKSKGFGKCLRSMIEHTLAYDVECGVAGYAYGDIVCELPRGITEAEQSSGDLIGLMLGDIDEGSNTLMPGEGEFDDARLLGGAHVLPGAVSLFVHSHPPAYVRPAGLPYTLTPSPNDLESWEDIRHIHLGIVTGTLAPMVDKSAALMLWRVRPYEDVSQHYAMQPEGGAPAAMIRAMQESGIHVATLAVPANGILARESINTAVDQLF